MLAKRIVPCLDVKAGRVVKGVNFVDLIDAGDPVEQAKVYDAEGADELVFLDITATHEARAIMIEMVRRVADSVFIPFTVGGGIRTVDDMRAILLAGADKVSVNSAIDARRRPAHSPPGSGWEVFVSGGRIPTGLDAVAWARETEQRGAGEILLTSMDSDGTKAGYDIELTRALSDAVSIPVIASGGAGQIDHFRQALVEGGAAAALAASLFHFRELSILSIKTALRAAGIPVRIPLELV